MTVTVLGENRLQDTRTGEIVGENHIHCFGYVFKNISSIDKEMVVGSGVGDSKIITLIAIPFSEHSVEGEGDNGQTVGDNGGSRQVA